MSLPISRRPHYLQLLTFTVADATFISRIKIPDAYLWLSCKAIRWQPRTRITSLTLAFGGVHRVVNLFEFADADLGVDDGGLQFDVTEHRLDVADVGTVYEHQRGHRVAKQVARAFLANLRGIDVPADEGCWVVSCTDGYDTTPKSRSSRRPSVLALCSFLLTHSGTTSTVLMSRSFRNWSIT